MNTNSEYLNAGDFICAHNFDCVHISEESHIILAQKIKEKIENTYTGRVVKQPFL